MKSFEQDLHLFESETQFYEDEEEPIRITQNLEREHYLFEFPTRVHLEALAYLDEGHNKYSFFDPFSFTATPSHENEGIQLPSRAIQKPRESMVTVEQSSFLSSRQVTQTNSDTSSCMDTEVSTIKTNEHRVLICLNKHNSSIIIVPPCATSVTDEGYDDTVQDDGKELDADSHFYEIQTDEDLKRDMAAVKIQSLWRGYVSRRHNKRPLMLQLVGLCGTVHRHQMIQFQKRMESMEQRLNRMTQLEKKLEKLEQKLEQETAMRRAFENTVEDMTVLIDHQQKALYDRLEEEVSLRRSHENKAQYLEAELDKEADKRSRMEDRITLILNQMHETETARAQQIEQETETRKQMQSKLNQAMNDIAHLKSNAAIKKTDTLAANKARKPAASDLPAVRTRPVSRRQPSSTTQTKPTTIPPNRRTVTPAKKSLLSQK